MELNNSHLTGLEVFNDAYLFVWVWLYLNLPFKKAIFISFKMQQPKSPESRLFSMCEHMIHTKSLHHYLVTFKKHCLWLQAGLVGNILGWALRSESEWRICLRNYPVNLSCHCRCGFTFEDGACLETLSWLMGRLCRVITPLILRLWQSCGEMVQKDKRPYILCQH